MGWDLLVIVGCVVVIGAVIAVQIKRQNSKTAGDNPGDDFRSDSRADVDSGDGDGGDDRD